MPETQKADWIAISRTVSLDALYFNARALKDSVYRQWMDNLRPFLLDPEPGKAAEAARRMDYIEQNLINGAGHA
jgi:hypothetical protein